MGLFREILNGILLPSEYLLTKYLTKKQSYPPIYIVGSPRSGSTLLMQVMVQYFKLGYISNLSCNFYRVPIVGSYLDRLISREQKVSNFNSNYGVTKGLSEPSEAADYWYSWFINRQDVNQSAREISKERLSGLYRQSRAMSAAQKMSYVHKNLYNSIRIKALATADPESLFIVISRDILITAYSIYTARLKQNPDVNSWWSVPPKNVKDLLGTDLQVQAVNQVYYIYKQILAEVEKYCKNRYYLIRYEELCQNPGDTMIKFKDWAAERGLHLNQRGIVLPQLNISTGQKMDPVMVRVMEQTLHELKLKEGDPLG